MQDALVNNKLMKSSAAKSIIPSGTVFPFAGDIVPDDFLLCNGQAVSRTDYEDLFNAIGTKYGSGDGSTTFNVPNLLNKFVEGTDLNTVGTIKSAGLPNITGTLEVNDFHGGIHIISGAFYQVTNNTGYQGPKDDGDNGTVGFDASRCSSIYGNSDTVQPPAVMMAYIIKI